MVKIVLIGAGSSQFGLGTVSDIFKSESLKNCNITLHDINKKALENIVFYIRNSFVIVVEYENTIVGTLAATIDETWYSDKKFMRTLWLHVHPKHRNYSIFRSIMVVFKEYALTRKVTAICEIFQGKDVERKNNIFTKLGFKNIGGTFIING